MAAGVTGASCVVAFIAPSCARPTNRPVVCAFCSKVTNVRIRGVSDALSENCTSFPSRSHCLPSLSKAMSYLAVLLR